MNKTKIEWADYTWNPVTGCLHNCHYCYARRIANRFADKNNLTYVDGVKPSHLSKVPYPYGFMPTFHKDRLNEPQKVKKPSKIFVCSMGDLFGDWVPDEWIEEVFNVVMETDHQYLFLTKNPKRYDNAIAYYANKERGFGLKEGYWDNCWFGTTVTHQEETGRVAELLKFEGGHKFVSIEPLLEPVDLTRIDLGGNTWINALTGDWKCYHPYGGVKTIEKSRQRIDWVIIGQQTNPDKPPKDEWVQSIIDQCRAAGVPVFVKKPLYERFPIQEWPEGMK